MGRARPAAADLTTWAQAVNITGALRRAFRPMKCGGLTPEQLALRSVPPSTLSLLGLVRHLSGAEAWFHSYDGQPDHQYFWDYAPGSTEAAKRSTSRMPPMTWPAIEHASTGRVRRGRARSRRSEPWRGLHAAVDLPAHDRGVRAPQRPRGLAPRTHRRRHGPVAPHGCDSAAAWSCALRSVGRFREGWVGHDGARDGNHLPGRRG